MLTRIEPQGDYYNKEPPHQQTIMQFMLGAAVEKYITIYIFYFFPNIYVYILIKIPEEAMSNDTPYHMVGPPQSINNS